MNFTNVQSHFVLKRSQSDSLWRWYSCNSGSGTCHKKICLGRRTIRLKIRLTFWLSPWCLDLSWACSKSLLDTSKHLMELLTTVITDWTIVEPYLFYWLLALQSLVFVGSLFLHRWIKGQRWKIARDKAHDNSYQTAFLFAWTLELKYWPASLE